MEIKPAMVAIAVFVVITVIAAVLMPVLGDATKTEDTFTNEGYYYMDKVTSTDVGSYVFAYKYENSTPSLTFNGEPLVLNYNFPLTLATDGSDWLVRYWQGNIYVGLQSAGEDFLLGGYGVNDLTITIGSGTATAVGIIDGQDDPTTVTTTYTDLYIYTEEKADYVMKDKDKPAYLLDDSTYLAMGQTEITHWYDVVHITGTVDDFTAEIVYPTGLTTTVTNKAIVKSAVSGHEDLYTLDKLTFTISDGTNTVDATYSYFIVPAEVTAERSVHLSANENAILLVIPALLIIAILIGILAVAFRMRD